MCGIAGAVTYRSPGLDFRDIARRMLSPLVHRGPDAEGIWISDSDPVVFGHRRLAIQDLSDSGSQPMYSSSGRYCIVFNGEIYNFKRLGNELRESGYNFKGGSDTEVLLAAIEEWGIFKAINKFVGMFAFALWDKKERELVLCRDRLGEKPLYYGWLNNDFYFASEIKSIENVAAGRTLDINKDALTSYFQYGYINAPLSIYENIYKLAPGSILRIKRDNFLNPAQFSPYPGSAGLCPTLYWSLLDAANSGLNSQFENSEDALDELETILRSAISDQLIADVGVGAFLSGGIDSTLVSAIAQSVSGQQINTFTIGFHEKEYDESGYAERIAKHLGTNHNTEFVSAADALDVIPNMGSIYDEPFADSSQLPTYLVSKIAKKHVTVCLSGDGGDELFAGYNRYAWSQSTWDKVGKIPLSLRKSLGAALLYPKVTFWDRIYERSLLYRAQGSNRQRMVGLKVQKLASYIQQPNIEEAYDFLLSYWDRPGLLVSNGDGNPLESIKSFPTTDKFIEKALYLDQVGYLPGDNLAKVDRASMGVSLETRLPLLDHRLVEYSWRVPLSMKVSDGSKKWILKQLLYKYVPRDMVDRPKMGFSVPVAQWLRNELFSWASDLIGKHRNNNTLINTRLVDLIWDEHTRSRRDHSLKLWSILMYYTWLDK